MRKSVSAWLAAALVPALTACSGNGSSVSSMGTITAFGTVVVNGVHYDATTATITRNGATVTEAELAVGHVAKIKGDNNDGTGHADSINVDDRLVGQITSINAVGGSLVALGQTVSVDSATSFDRIIVPSGLTGLAVGDVIEVSGLAAPDGHIAATRIERKDSATFQAIGRVAGLDTTGHTFAIEALTVDYSAAVVSGFTTGAPAEGDLVEVQGTTFDAVTTTLTATQVSPAPDETSDAGSGDNIEREGLITRFALATDFDVADRPVTTTSTTEFDGGTVADLVLNGHVEVKGALDANDVLVASTIGIHKAGIVELKGNVTAVDTTAGTITVLGVTVTASAETRFEDKSDAAALPFDLTNLSVGDTIDVRGFEDPVGSSTLTATRLDRKNPDTAVVVGAFFEATTPPRFTILGITIDTTNAVFTRDWQTALTSDAFFAQAPGDVVFAIGTLNGTTVEATKVTTSSCTDCAEQDEHEGG